MANLACILSGATHGSTTLTVGVALPNGTNVNVWRGTFWLGSGTLAAGVCTITVPALAQGDLVQASVGERGNGAGLPVLVASAEALPTGWITPTTIVVRDGDQLTTLTAEQYRSLYGQLPPAVYAPETRISVVAPDCDPLPAVAAAAPTVLFDLKVDMQVGQTVVTVGGVSNVTGNPLIRWADGEPFGNTFSRTFTQAATITIAVKGENDTQFVTRQIAFDVFNPPAAPVPPMTELITAAYQSGSVNGVNIATFYVNSTRPSECRLDGLDAAGEWHTCTLQGTDFQQYFYPNIPKGTYRFFYRLAGDTDATRWKSFVYVAR